MTRARSAAAATLAAIATSACSWGCGSRTSLDGRTPREAGVVEAGCGADNCAGCCDEVGRCQPGTEATRCGIGGAACQACDTRYDVCDPHGGGEHVVGQVCWAACEARSCSGCCVAGRGCVAGDADHACGWQSVCTNCTAMGLVCGYVGGQRGCVTGP